MKAKKSGDKNKIRKPYNHSVIEKKHQKVWLASTYSNASQKSKDQKYYCLVEFPYPSGEGLHVGHVRSYTAMDVIARKRRAEGYNVLYPIGWDAFGLPTENFAIKTGKDPRVITKQNTNTFRRQLQSLGISFDWNREIDTTDPEYYRWTQFIFLKFLEHDLAYKAKVPINWCPKDKIGLANEEVVDGACERCGTLVEKREKEQWMLRITKYADRLDSDLDTVDYLEKIKLQQRNWIGKSEGAEIDFELVTQNSKLKTIKVFTTRPDTIFGATYIVLSPEHEILNENELGIENNEEIQKYIATARKKTEIERTDHSKKKSGIEIKGIFAINPATKEKIPVYVADYVLAGYGTGAVMAVPAHDERDYAFAKVFNLPIREVVIPTVVDKRNPPVHDKDYVPRRNVHPIVRNPKTGKYLAVKWKKFDWITFPMGGIDDGEDVVVAAMREVREETGYKNLKLIKVLQGQVRAEYFAAHKDQNRISYTTAVLFDLENDEQEEIDQKEMDVHDVIWLDESQLTYEHMTHTEIDAWREKLKPTYTVYSGDGTLVNSGQFSEKSSEELKKEIVKFVGGKWVNKYKLRDWVFSRQRYWGEPIPVIHCEVCGIVPVPDKDLPVLLPKVKKYEPTDTGESPLASISSWVNVKCPTCKEKAKRETDVMPNWAGSSWYFLRYADPKNKKAFASSEALQKFTPVDWYNGGMEHTTLHLLYSRFWNKFLYDIKLVPHSEPYKKRTSHGLILAANGEKMSKSKGNVVNPDQIVSSFGADTLRMYEMFMGPFDQAIAWSTEGVVGPRRFMERVWNLQNKVSKNSSQTQNSEVTAVLHKTIKQVTDDIESMSFNTAISALMICANRLEKENEVHKDVFITFLKLLSPFAPHITEELFHLVGGKKSIHTLAWPQYDEKLLVSETVSIAVQINGKVRGSIIVNRDALERDIEALVRVDLDLKKWIESGDVKRVIHVKNKLISFVVQS